MHFIFFSQLFEFDQSEFFGGSPDSAYMDAIGYVYVPESCQNGEGECMCCSLNSVCLLMNVDSVCLQILSLPIAHCVSRVQTGKASAIQQDKSPIYH